MAALTADRNTLARSGDLREPPVKANALLYAGGMAALDAAGFAVPAAAVATLRVIGRVRTRADNTGGTDGAIRVQVEPGVFRFGNSAAADAIGLKDVGQPCYAVDDQTVALTSSSGARPFAGTIFDVDAQGVWVKFS